MIEKQHKLVKISIHPETVVEGEKIPMTLAYQYKTDIIEDGIVIATLASHRGSVSFHDNTCKCAISPDGTTRSVAEIKREAGLEDRPDEVQPRNILR